jgi:nucleotide-binding universal stress UspA family protein
MKISEMFGDIRQKAVIEAMEEVQERRQPAKDAIDEAWRGVIQGQEDGYEKLADAEQAKYALDKLGKALTESISNSKGRSVDLSDVVVDHGYNHEDAMQSPEGAPTLAESLKTLHQTQMAAVSDIVKKLEDAGVYVDTSFRTLEPWQVEQQEKTQGRER